MREILFRAKRADNGEWVESDCIMQFKPHPMTEQEEVHLWQHGEGWVACHLDTLCQYTGLQDRNGKRIFEGDVVWGLFLHSRPVKSLVVFRDGAFGLLWNRAGAETYWAFTSICNVEYEIIGNIHDNPELLKGE